jgi:predicted MPP superfamily phosphohydrolase
MKNMFIITLLIIFILINAFVYFRIRGVLPNNIYAKVAFNLVFAAIIGVFLFAVFSRSHLSLRTFSIINNYTVTWLLSAVYFMLLCLLVGIVNILNNRFHFLPFDTHTLFAKRLIMLSQFTLIAVVLVMGRCNFNNKKVEQFSISINKKANVETLKIVAASDLHLGYSIDKSEFQKIVDLINSRNPDIVLFAGDIADMHSQPLAAQNMHEEFLQIRAPLGIYAVVGNHECYGDAENTVEYLRSADVTVLRDSIVLLDSGFYIAGRNDKAVRNRQELSALLANIDKQKPIILLDHQPFNLEQAQENGIDLQISGHTHGGQLFPFTLITKFIYEQQHGYLKKGETHYYISSGIGGWGAKLRIGSQSKIAEITLHFEKQTQ